MIKPKESHLPAVTTQNEKAKVVIHDMASYRQKQEVSTLLKILALSQQQVEANRLTPIEEVVQRLKSRSKKD
ncbi:antitoxin, Phd family protein [Limnobaculum parvum]|nr:antitoxin, Phd family protein [Limnobaculum parvum]